MSGEATVLGGKNDGAPADMHWVARQYNNRTVVITLKGSLSDPSCTLNFKDVTGEVVDRNHHLQLIAEFFGYGILAGVLLASFLFWCFA